MSPRKKSSVDRRNNPRDSNAETTSPGGRRQQQGQRSPKQQPGQKSPKQQLPSAPGNSPGYRPAQGAPSRPQVQQPVGPKANPNHRGLVAPDNHVNAAIPVAQRRNTFDFHANRNDVPCDVQSVLPREGITLPKISEESSGAASSVLSRFHLPPEGVPPMAPTHSSLEDEFEPLEPLEMRAGNRTNFGRGRIPPTAHVPRFATHLPDPSIQPSQMITQLQRVTDFMNQFHEERFVWNEERMSLIDENHHCKIKLQDERDKAAAAAYETAKLTAERDHLLERLRFTEQDRKDIEKLAVADLQMEYAKNRADDAKENLRILNERREAETKKLDELKAKIGKFDSMCMKLEQDLVKAETQKEESIKSAAESKVQFDLQLAALRDQILEEIKLGSCKCSQSTTRPEVETGEVQAADSIADTLRAVKDSIDLLTKDMVVVTKDMVVVKDVLSRGNYIPVPPLMNNNLVTPFEQPNVQSVESTAIAEPVAPTVAEPVATTVAEPVATAIAEPVATTVAEPVATAIAEPVAPTVAEPVATAVSEPVAPTVGCDMCRESGIGSECPGICDRCSRCLYLCICNPAV
eukprot:GHVH01015714.1.p1 GENE.GHVH01015714.1~~GHVH01015714.1.p1  ORF type:complete len:577 (-),score=87.40 GHVH01015714.1:1825-3555(-)